MNSVFRWIVVLPSATLASVAVGPIIYFLNRITGSDGLFEQLWMQLVTPGFSGFVFVWIAKYTAPSYKVQVSISATIIIVFMSGMEFAAKYLLGDRILSDMSLLHVSFILIIASFGAGVGCYQAYEEAKSRKDLEVL